jgi:hypothetical protein
MPNWGSVDPVWLKLGSKSKFRMKKTVCSKLNFQKKQNVNKPFFLPKLVLRGSFSAPSFGFPLYTTLTAAQWLINSLH